MNATVVDGDDDAAAAWVTLTRVPKGGLVGGCHGLLIEALARCCGCRIIAVNDAFREAAAGRADRGIVAPGRRWPASRGGAQRQHADGDQCTEAFRSSRLPRHALDSGDHIVVPQFISIQRLAKSSQRLRGRMDVSIMRHKRGVISFSAAAYSFINEGRLFY